MKKGDKCGKVRQIRQDCSLCSVRRSYQEIAERLHRVRQMSNVDTDTLSVGQDREQYNFLSQSTKLNVILFDKKT